MLYTQFTQLFSDDIRLITGLTKPLKKGFKKQGYMVNSLQRVQYLTKGFRGFRINLKSKKSMSPLVATILLIAFAVTIGAMIMNITANVSDCSKIDISLKIVNNKTTFCYDKTSNNVRFVLENTGSGVIDGFLIRIVDEKLNVIEQELEASRLSPGKVLHGSFPYRKKFNSNVEIIPFILQANGDKKICNNAIIEVQELRDC